MKYSYRIVPVAASTTLHQGALAGVAPDGSGYATNVTATPNMRVLGVVVGAGGAVVDTAVGAGVPTGASSAVSFAVNFLKEWGEKSTLVGECFQAMPNAFVHLAPKR